MAKLMTYVMCQRVTGFATVFQSQVSGRTFMTKGPLAFVAVALLLASSMETSALGALQSPYSGRVAHHVSRADQNMARMRAAVQERATVFPSARPLPYPYNYHETDGLSRNPNDCAVWGCIDSN